MQGKEETADGLIEQMTRSKDAILRYGGMSMVEFVENSNAKISILSVIKDKFLKH